MAQMSIFLTEHAGEIAVAWYGIATVLLLVTLHRMRQIKKLLQKMTERDAYLALSSVDKPDQSMLCESVGETPDKRMEVEQSPQELIDAVLGEVFS